MKIYLKSAVIVSKPTRIAANNSPVFNVAGDCREAGHTSCCNPTEDKNLCSVQTGPNTHCYCNETCRGSNDCCTDIDTVCPVSTGRM